MKKFFLKPGFEAIFALSLMVILGLPPVLLAQVKKDLEINIINGDTTVNGKNIRSLSAADRLEALKDINRMSSQLGNNNGGGSYSFKEKDSIGSRINRFKFLNRKSDLDSLGNMSDGKPENLRRMDYNFAFRNNDGNNLRLRERNFNTAGMRFERRNTQTFDYLTTDEEGASTHIRFHISDVSNDDLKRMPHVEGGKFEISDLSLVPEFSTGKTLLMFNLPAKTVAEVKLTNTEGKVLWNEKATGGSFRKSFIFGLNGAYYLQVKQGHNISIKKIMKEE